MNYILQNDKLKATFKTAGAELTSVVSTETGREYMWYADPKFWCRTSPVLFPAVGGLKNGTYTYQGKEYQLEKHGFARNMEFELEKQTEDQLIFRLEATDETKKSFPFEFVLRIIYTLTGNKLRVDWEVVNRDEKTMYFSIGGHPAFLHPENVQPYILFDSDEIICSQVDTPTGLLAPEEWPLPLENRAYRIDDHAFDHDALVIQNHQSHQVALADDQMRVYVKVTFDAPLYGVWAPPGKGVPFVCIEPWYGRCDRIDFSSTLEEREYGNQAAPGETFTAGYEIEYC